MKHLRIILTGVLLLCLCLRAMAWLVAPVIPLLIVLFLLSSVYVWLFHPRQRL